MFVPQLARLLLAGVYTPLARAHAAVYRQSTQRLRQREGEVQRDADRAAKQLAIQARQKYSTELERRLLDQALDVTVSTHGAEHTTLRLTYVLFNRVWAHKFSE